MKTKIQKLNFKTLVCLVLLGGIGALPVTASAQSSTTNALPVSPQNFFQTAANYFTSANTNYTWTGNTIEVAAGADYMSSVNWANYLDAQYDIGRFNIAAKMRNAGIAGTVDSAEAGIGYTLISYYSVKLEAGIDGGYDLDRNTALIEPKLTLRDKLTPNTFLGLAISLPIWANGRPMNTVPDIGIETGFTY
jgi:hypothetical protein